MGSPNEPRWQHSCKSDQFALLEKISIPAVLKLRSEIDPAQQIHRCYRYSEPLSNSGEPLPKVVRLSRFIPVRVGKYCLDDGCGDAPAVRDQCGHGARCTAVLPTVVHQPMPVLPEGLLQHPGAPAVPAGSSRTISSARSWPVPMPQTPLGRLWERMTASVLFVACSFRMMCRI
jgi:hypothetical protein